MSLNSWFKNFYVVMVKETLAGDVLAFGDSIVKKQHSSAPPKMSADACDACHINSGHRLVYQLGTLVKSESVATGTLKTYAKGWSNEIYICDACGDLQSMRRFKRFLLLVLDIVLLIASAQLLGQLVNRPPNDLEEIGVLLLPFFIIGLLLCYGVFADPPSLQAVASCLIDKKAGQSLFFVDQPETSQMDKTT